MITASALPRLAVCPASASLPQEDYQTKHAEDGTERHAQREQAVSTGKLSDLPEDVRALIEPGSLAFAEVAMAYDLVSGTARQLGLNIGREYHVTPNEIPGTLDLLILFGKRKAIICDYKGYQDTDAWAQVMHHALCVSRIHGVDDISVAIRWETGVIEKRDLHMIEVEAFAAELEFIVAATRNPKAPVVSGHCKYCPAFNACPAQRSLALQVKDDSLWTRVEATNLNNDEVAADFHDLWRRVQLLATRMGAKVYARAKERPIPLHSGKLLAHRIIEGNRHLDARKGHAIIAAKYGDPIADAAVDMDLTQKGIEEALKMADLGGKSRAKAKEEIMADLERAGGVTRKPVEKYVEIDHQLAEPKDAA